MSVTTTYADLVKISEMGGLFLRDDELGQYPAIVRANRSLRDAAVYRETFVDNPQESDASWLSGDGPDVAEADQLVDTGTEKVLVHQAVWSVTMPRSLACLAPSVANWLLATYDATTIDSMFRLAKDYVQTVAEMYHERTTP